MMKKEIAVKLHKDRDEINKFYRAFKKVYMFGAGSAAKLVLRYFEEEGLSLDGIIVSSRKNIGDMFSGIKVYEITEIEFGDSIGIVLGVGIELQAKIKKQLLAEGVRGRQIYCQKIYLQYIDYYEKEYSSNWHESEGGYFCGYKELDQLGKKYNTDKSSLQHNYLNKYEFFLEKWKDKEMKLLELGVLEGGSLNTWSEYFEKGQIYGVDIDENCLQYAGGNKHVIIQDLADEEALEELAEMKPDIIIDDASHYWSHQIKAIYHLIPSLPSGGVFIMEDLNTSHAVHRMNGFDDSTVSGYEFCEALAKTVNSGVYLADGDLKSALVCLKEEISYLAAQIEMISFIHDSCIMIKK